MEPENYLAFPHLVTDDSQDQIQPTASPSKRKSRYPY